VRLVAGTRGRAGDRGLGGQGDADHGNVGGDRRLEDRVDVVQAVAVRGDVLGGEREHLGGDTAHRLVDRHQIRADREDVPLADGGGDGDAAVVDDPVALGGVDGDDRVHLRQDLVGVHGV